MTPLASVDAHGRQGPDELRYMELRHDIAVHKTADHTREDACRDHHRERQQGVCVNVRHHHAHQCHGASGGEVDACGDDDEGDAHADDRRNGSVADDLDQVVKAQEFSFACACEDRKQYDKNEQHADGDQPPHHCLVHLLHLSSVLLKKSPPEKHVGGPSPARPQV